MDRRRFLRGAARWSLAVAGLGPVAAACTSDRPRPPSPSATTPTPSVPASPSGPAVTPWAQLAGRLDGTLVRPGESAYRDARLNYNPRFDGVRPTALVFPETERDVATTIAFAGDHDVEFAVRCGGHSYAGYSLSEGIVLDVSRMSAVRTQPGGLATVGAGARLIDVASGLAPAGVMIPGGTCATVGISGLTLGGGQGVTARLLGLTCDSLQAASVVTSDGRTLVCDADHHEDLFWALRGGGGGNLGVVTSFTFKTHPAPALTLVALHWPWADAAAVLGAWQEWGPSAPRELWSSCRLRSQPGIGPTVAIEAIWAGPPSSVLDGRLSALSAMVGASPTRSVTTLSYRDAAFYLAGCNGFSTAQCRLTIQSPAGKLEREASLARSDFFDRPISGDVAQSLLRSVETRSGSPQLERQEGGVVLDAWGGRISDVADDATAIPHRQARFLAQEFVTFRTKLSAQVLAENKRWLDGMWQALRPAASGFAYVNYIDPDLPDWPRAYYGANLSRLVEVKRAYDPGNVFRSRQSIPVSMPA